MRKLQSLTTRTWLGAFFISAIAVFSVVSAAGAVTNIGTDIDTDGDVTVGGTIYLEDSSALPNNAMSYGLTGLFGQSDDWQPNGSEGLWLEYGNGESAGAFFNEDMAAIWSAGDSVSIFSVYDEDNLSSDPDIEPYFSVSVNGGVWIGNEMLGGSVLPDHVATYPGETDDGVWDWTPEYDNLFVEGMAEFDGDVWFDEDVTIPNFSLIVGPDNKSYINYVNDVYIDDDLEIGGDFYLDGTSYHYGDEYYYGNIYAGGAYAEFDSMDVDGLVTADSMYSEGTLDVDDYATFLDWIEATNVWVNGGQLDVSADITQFSGTSLLLDTEIDGDLNLDVGTASLTTDIDTVQLKATDNLKFYGTAEMFNYPGSLQYFDYSAGANILTIGDVGAADTFISLDLGNEIIDIEATDEINLDATVVDIYSDDWDIDGSGNADFTGSLTIGSSGTTITNHYQITGLPVTTPLGSGYVAPCVDTPVGPIVTGTEAVIVTPDANPAQPGPSVDPVISWYGYLDFSSSSIMVRVCDNSFWTATAGALPTITVNVDVWTH